MKNLSYLLGLIIVAGIIFNACKKDEDESQPPSISFKTGTSDTSGIKYLTSDTTLYVNEYFLVGISASSNISENLNRFQIMRKYENEDVIIYKDTSFSSSTFNVNEFIKANEQDGGTEIFTFKIYDKAGNSNSLHLTITTIPLQPPSISFKTGIHEPSGMKYLTSDTTLYVNEYFLVGISASSNISEDLNRFQIMRKYENGNVIIYKDTSFSSSTFDVNEFINANEQGGTEDFTFKIYDKASNYNSLHLTITTLQLPSTINEYTNVELFYDTISPNSAFASTTGEVINIANAATNANKVDWIYFKDLIYGHTIIAPTETSILSDVFDTAYITGWSQYNATTFARTQWAASEFDGIDNKTSLIAATWNQDYSTFISQLKPEPGEGFDVNDVYAFYTGQYKYGLIKITEVNKGAKNGESSIKCDVKVVK